MSVGKGNPSERGEVACRSHGCVDCATIPPFASYNEREGDGALADGVPLEAFKKEMADCGFEWVKEVGFVHVHIFEHTATGRVMPVVVERGEVRAAHVENARKICDELRGGGPPSV